ncbi:uncharacterized protein N7503_000010 [Penicillium pulvis]|uniref:uncharacterized protein n=1 Tax=Penicillium pulvis TaxID=1562058 RepID=UPI0025483872|nr:uncharacterized protein N7503_000010 [Penicillium pulvis]KAJ5813260.1 hypothetical protein N7503_000010 [Penicillium pulvis]
MAKNKPIYVTSDSCHLDEFPVAKRELNGHGAAVEIRPRMEREQVRSKVLGPSSWHNYLGAISIGIKNTLVIRWVTTSFVSIRQHV